MRYEPCVWPKGFRRDVTTRRVAAASRSIARDIERNALTPELVRFTDPFERLAHFDADTAEKADHFRAFQAKAWRLARADLAALPPVSREAVRRFWDAAVYPASPSYLSTLCLQVRRGRSLWRFLRYRRAMELIRNQRLDRRFLPIL